MPMSVYCVLIHNAFQLSYFVSTCFSTANLDGLAKFVSNFTLIVALGAWDQYRTSSDDMQYAFMPCALEKNSKDGFKRASAILLFKL